MNKLLYIFTTCLLLVLFSCDQKDKVQDKASQEKDLDKYALELSKKFIITDGHIDLPYRLKEEGFLGSETLPDLTKDTEGNFDHAKAVRGGLDAPFMSIYIPASLQKTGGSKELADSLINMVGKICTDFPEHFALANTPTDVEKNFKEGKISLPMGMENGSAIENELKNVKYFYDRGIRYITLTHSKDNLICDSSYDTTRTWNGLSAFGAEVVREMNNHGIMIDISHVSDSTFYQVMKITKAPAIASHSSCRHFTPDFERNMSDDMVKVLAKNGGVIQINFGSTFLLKRSQDQFKEVNNHMDSVLRAQGKITLDDELMEYKRAYANKVNAYANVKDAADHIDHVVSLVGVNHVGLGSDYDGVGDSLPDGLKDASSYPNLIKELLVRGYSEEDIEKICYSNVFRVWNAVIAVAAEN